MHSHYKIAVLGLWHLGEVYSAGLAELGHDVIGISEDEALIESFRKNIPPLAEPRLQELIRKNQSAGNLSYETDFAKIRECNVVWFAFDTPVDDDDNVNLEVIFDALKKSLDYLQDGVLIVVSSQLPAGTSRKIIEMIHREKPGLKSNYAYTPENLRLGDAVRCFLKPGRIVIGADEEEAVHVMKDIFSGLNAEIISMSPPSAEMAKHALNAFLAASMSFTNDLADVCEVVGADIEDVVKALKSDPRIGEKAYLFAGLGFSGGTLGRDIKALMAIAKDHAISLPVISGVFEKNRSRNGIVLRRLQEELGDIRGKKFSMFGVTYKAGTSTLRRSQPLEIEKDLRANGAVLRLYDPLAKPEEVAHVTPSMFFKDPYEAAKDADAILVMTPSASFREFDFAKLKAAAKNPILYDTCNILCPKEREIKSAGFRYLSIGR